MASMIPKFDFQYNLDGLSDPKKSFLPFLLGEIDISANVQVSIVVARDTYPCLQPGFENDGDVISTPTAATVKHHDHGLLP